MKIYMLVALVLSLSACDNFKGDKGNKGDAGAPAPITITPVVPVDEVQDDIDALVADESAYRQGLGQTALNRGLSCTVQVISSGQKILNSSPAAGTVITMTGSSYAFRYGGTFNQPDSNVGVSNIIPTSIKPLFVGLNYLIRCQGQIVVRETNYYDFDVTSDDGSLLYLDGAVVINNDGNHGMTQAFGTRFLRRGVHTFRIDYAQTGGGNFGLILKAGGSTIDSRYFYY